MHTRRRLLAQILSTAAFAGGTCALAQETKRLLRLVVGFPAGGGTDIIARVLADRVRVPFASSVIVENKPGAAARLSVDYVKNAVPDGATLLFTPDFPITVYPHSFQSLSYDPLRDLVPVAPGAKSMLCYNIGPAVPASVTTLKGFVQWVRDNPDKASYATTSAGGTPHFVGMMFATAAGIAMTPVHYRGGAPALQDLLGGHVPASVNPVSEALPHAKSGALRELGFDVAIDSWLGAFAPARTPVETVRVLGAAINEVARSPDYAESLAKFGNEPALQTPEEFAATVRVDIARWGPVVKASGFVAVD